MASSLNGAGTLTWTGNSDTLDTDVTNPQPTTAKCPKNYFAESSQVVVTGSGGDGYDAALVTGTQYTNVVCISSAPAGTIKLPKGGSFTL